MITSTKEVFVTEYHELQEILNAHERAHWVADEADMRTDVEQWKSGKISEEEKSFIKMILRLFTQADTDVCSAYVNRLLPIFKHPDARTMLLSFANREVTHMLGYKRLNDTLGYDDEAFMNEFLSYAEMRDKHEFIVSEVDLSTEEGIAEYLVKQVLFEGVNLFASFAMLLSFSQEGKLPGMVAVNQWSQADESHHVNGLVALFKIFVEENPKVVTDNLKKIAYETARTIVSLEDKFVDLCFSVGETTCIDKEQLKKYIRYVCDYRMQQLGFKSQFNVKSNPIEWMDQVTGATLGNFFETTTVQYSKANLSGEWKY